MVLLSAVLSIRKHGANIRSLERGYSGTSPHGLGGDSMKEGLVRRALHGSYVAG